jgi:hypothetical protein
MGMMVLKEAITSGFICVEVLGPERRQLILWALDGYAAPFGHTVGI